MSFQFLNAGRSGDITQVTPIDTFIDPVSKIRVSNPSNLIDTDFEYGLQPTKWETVELINNTPAFFSRGGDTTIPDITGITTNAGTREITVTTAFPHNLDVGVPIRVAGTKSITADGSYIINATPTPTTFTYLSRANQSETISIFDLYTSIISGEFFQGSQISLSDAEGMVTDGEGPFSEITVKTETRHGFGPNTPFYFLNLNSTISQEFESNNNSSISFDPTNSATAQEFDGSNTLLQTPIDISNSATSIIAESSITSTSPGNGTISVATPKEDWSILQFGDPLYYSVNAGSGYFQQNPRGIVFIKSVEGVDPENQTATFQVSELPDGDTIPILANMTGFFQIADQARTFAGNNVNPQTQIEVKIEAGQEFIFDGGNQGFDGDPESPPNNQATVVGYTGTTATVFTAEGSLDYYIGAMLKYSTDGNAATGLENNATYFVTNFSEGASPGLFTISIAEFPGDSDIEISGGSGTQTFSKIGVSVDKNIVHVRNADFELKSMLEYSFPLEGNFAADEEKIFYFVQEKLDTHNFVLGATADSSISATGGTSISTIIFDGEPYIVHRFTEPGTFTFEVENEGTFEQEIRFVTAPGNNQELSTFNGDFTSTGSFTPSREVYTVFVPTGGRVDIAYPETGVPNIIPHNEINPVPLTATGGSVSNTTVGTTPFRVHTFTSPNITTTLNTTFQVVDMGNISESTFAEYLVIAGGGGSSNRGGAGAGGYRCSVVGEISGRNTSAEPRIELAIQSYNVTVGRGGAASSNGANSVFGNIVSTGGGRGASGAGGSGGGADGRSRGGGAGAAGQGFEGGSTGGGSQFRDPGGGGGGASGAGGGASQSGGGNGGGGRASSITGSSVARAGGGAGFGTGSGATLGSASAGGGRDSNGAANTGGGGGARNRNGGSGLVVVRYPLT
jgi:hypothetical protein